MIKKLLLGLLLLLSVNVIFADNPNNIEDLNIYFNGTLGNIGTINNSGSYTNPSNAFDENSASFADITTTSQISNMQYIGKSFSEVYLENLYFEIKYEWSGTSNTFCGYDVQILNDTGWHSVETVSIGVQCLNNQVTSNISINQNVQAVQVGMRNTNAGGTSRTLKVEEIIPYKTNLNGIDNYYNSSTFDLNFENTFDDYSSIKTFLATESSLPTFNDGTLNGYTTNDGTCNNMGDICNRTLSVNSSFGNAISFDGSDDTITLNDITQIADNNDFSFSGWIYKRGTFDGAVFYYETGNDRFSINYHSSGELRSGFFDGGSFIGSSSGSINTDEWVNFIYTYDGGTQNGTLYLNGVKQTGTNSISVGGIDGTWFGARNGGANFFNGNIDSIAIYDFTIAENQIIDYKNNINPTEKSILSYNFDESNTITTLDSHMFVEGNISNDVWNRALAFNGSQYIEITDSNDLDLTSEGTLAFWTKYSSNQIDTFPRFIDKTQNAYELSIRDSNNKIFFQLGGTLYFDDVVDSVDDDQWTHVAISWDGNNVVQYKNGVVVDNETQTSNASTLTDNILIGQEHGLTGGLVASLDDVYILNKGLTPSQVSSLYNKSFYNTSNLVYSINAEQINNTIIFDRKTELCTNCSKVNKTFYSPVTEGIYSLWSFDTFSGMKIRTNNYFDYTNPVLTDNLPSEYNNTRTINLSSYISQSSSISGLNSCIVEFSTGESDNCTSESLTVSQAGNVSYTITLIDNAFNSVTSSSIIYFNPLQYFRFFNTDTSNFVTDYTFGGVNESNEYIIFSLFGDILEIGSNTLDFIKDGLITTSFTFNVTNTSLINNTYNVSESEVIITIKDQNTLSLVPGIDFNLEFVGNSGFNTSTNTSTATIKGLLADDEYRLITSSNQFETETNFFEFNGQESLSLTVYVQNSSAPRTGTVNIKIVDIDDNIITDATVRALQWDVSSSSFIGVSEEQTDESGEGTLNIILEDKIYIFTGEFENRFINSTDQRITTTEDGSTITLTLPTTAVKSKYRFEDLITQVTESYNNVTNISTITFQWENTIGESEEVCINTYRFLNGISSRINESCTTGVSGVFMQSFFINSTYDIVLKGEIKENGNYFTIESFVHNSQFSPPELLKQLNLAQFVLPILMLLSAGIGLAISRTSKAGVYVGSILMGTSGGLALFLAPDFITAGIVLGIMIIAGMIMWGSTL